MYIKYFCSNFLKSIRNLTIHFLSRTFVSFTVCISARVIFIPLKIRTNHAIFLHRDLKLSTDHTSAARPRKVASLTEAGKPRVEEKEAP